MKPQPQPVKLDPITLTATLILKLIRYIRSSKKDPSAKVQQVIEATGLKNLQGQSPTLTDTHPTETGSTLTYRLPPGIIPKDFIDRQPHFNTHGSFESDIISTGTPVLKINTYHNSLPTEIPYEYQYDPSHGIAPLPLGKTPSNKTHTIDLSKLPHLLIGGVTGFGKTSLLLTLSVAQRQAGCQVYTIDHKRLDFPTLSDYLHVSTTEQETLTLFRYLTTELYRRLDLLSGNAQNIQSYKGETLPYISVIVDELNTINDKETQTHINTIARLGRAAGISLILATQKPSAHVWDGFTDTRDLCSGRISFFVTDYFMSQAILGKGNTKACNLPMIPGRAITVMGNKETTIQTMYLTAEQAKTELEKLGKVKPLEPNRIWTPEETTDNPTNPNPWSPNNTPDNPNLLPGFQPGTQHPKRSTKNGKTKANKKNP